MMFQSDHHTGPLIAVYLKQIGSFKIKPVTNDRVRQCFAKDTFIEYEQ